MVGPQLAGFGCRARGGSGFGLGFRVWGLGFGVWGLGFRVSGCGFTVRTTAHLNPKHHFPDYLPFLNLSSAEERRKNRASVVVLDPVDLNMDVL